MTIDIDGPEGNAFALLAYARQFAVRLGKDKTDILDRMRSGDYEHLLAVFHHEFGEVVTLIRDGEVWTPDDEEDDE